MVITDDQLKELIIKTKLLDQAGLEKMGSYAKTSGVSLSQALVENNLITDENLGLLISDYLKLPFIILSKTSIPEEVFQIVPERIAKKNKVIAFARDKGTIKIAMADPKNTELLTHLAKKTGAKMVPYFATERDISNTFQIYRKDAQIAFAGLIKTDAAGKLIQSSLADTPVTKLVDLLITYGVQDKASDIHIEPQEKNTLVRFRIDGMLHDILTFPKELHDRMVTRIKVLSRLRTDEHMGAQDGKMRTKVDEESLDIRVSIIPITVGEKVVMRLLSGKARQYSLVDLGMSPEDLDKLTKAFSRSFGMILSTGPTGSGKSTTIYSILKII